jgi:hypothetical protein
MATYPVHIYTRQVLYNANLLVVIGRVKFTELTCFGTGRVKRVKFTELICFSTRRVKRVKFTCVFLFFPLFSD